MGFWTIPDKYLDANYDETIFSVGRREYEVSDPEILITITAGSVTVEVNLLPGEAADLIKGLKRAVKDFK
jgi:hypothetical protein